MQWPLRSFRLLRPPDAMHHQSGRPSTWQSHRGNGRMDAYDPVDAIASPGHYLHRLLAQARGDIAADVLDYNHSQAGVADVLERARTYSTEPEASLIAPA